MLMNRKHEVNVVCDYHVTALYTCWTTKLSLKSKEVLIFTSWALTLTAAKLASKADIYTSLTPDYIQKETIFLVTHFCLFLTKMKLLHTGQYCSVLGR